MKLPLFQQKSEEDPLLEAIDLRTRYGADAEEWCEIGILATDALSRRRALYRVREALRALPAEEFAPC
jgi:hypothetical protein